MSSERLYFFLCSFWLAGMVWICISFTDLFENHSASVCIFKQTTGLACPSCGTTRSIHSILDGEFFEGLKINPFGLFGAVAMIILPFWLLMDYTTKRKTLFRSWLSFEYWIKKPVIFWPAIIVVIANWVWNISKEL